MEIKEACPFCGSKNLEVYVFQCDRHGWEMGWEPSIVCECGISFGIGFAGPGVDPDKVEEMIIRKWDKRCIK